MTILLFTIYYFTTVLLYRLLLYHLLLPTILLFYHDPSRLHIEDKNCAGRASALLVHYLLFYDFTAVLMYCLVLFYQLLFAVHAGAFC